MADPGDNTTEVPTRNEVDQEHVEAAKKELEQAIRGSHQILASASTVFPFTPFPHTVTVDRAKLTITHRSFFQVSEVMSIRIEDVLNVTANVGPFLGSLHIVSRVMNADKPYQINFLWREDAMKLKRILQGYIIAMQNNIDCTPLTTQELSTLLNQLGKDDHPEIGK